MVTREPVGALLGWRAILVLLLSTAISAQQCAAGPTKSRPRDGVQADRLQRVKAVWQQRQQRVAGSDLAALQHQAWNMFDHGFSNYMRHAYPMDNLMPLSCQGQNWQGGLALTLVDSLDTLALMNRRADLQEAVEHLRLTLDFDKDEKVHVFETTIRVLGGLLSGHVLLQSDRGLVPGYDGLLLRAAQDLGDRLLAAFDTPSGLPGGHVHLRQGLVAGENISCTACAGTLLMEFGLLSRLTQDARYMRAADHAARVLFERRSPLGLVGSSFHVGANTWTHLGSTIGPGSDSYYEYLLKAYLMFGDRQYLDMFIELYVATMRHMKLPGMIPNRPGTFGSAFLMDVHMDSGRLLKPWVSSLGAFWPAMQVLAGQSDDAAALHANFTSAWATWGWLPEVFGVDLGAVHPEDPGYNLRPEHIESTWYLAALTGDPTGHYRGLAANMLRVLNHSWVGCGYAPISDVSTGVHTDLMESYFLSETVKYLYLSFVDSGGLLDYYVLSTEGHIMPSLSSPVDAHVEEDDHLELLMMERDERLREKQEADAAAAAKATCESGNGSCTALNASQGNGTEGGTRSHTSRSHTRGSESESESEMSELSLVGAGLRSLPANCRPLCAVRRPEEERAAERTLHRALPLLPLELRASRRIRYRRCVACIKTTEALAAMPPDPLAAQLARFNFGQKSYDSSSSSAGSSGDSSSRAAAVAAMRGGSHPSKPPSTDVEALPSAQGVVVLSQALCLMRVVNKQLDCEVLRAVTALDTTSLLPQNAVIMQLSGLRSDSLPVASPVLLAAVETEDGGLSSLQMVAALASFGPEVPVVSEPCLAAMVAAVPDLQSLPHCPPQQLLEQYATLSSSSSSVRVSKRRPDVWLEGHYKWQQQQQAAEDPWLRMSPSSETCAALRKQQQQQREEEGRRQLEGVPAGSSSSSSDDGSSSSRRLQALCMGYDASTTPSGFWLPQPDLFNSSHPCSRNQSAAAAARSAAAAAAPAAALLPLAAPLVLAQPATACKMPRNAAMLNGSIAVVKRGACSFVDKAMFINQAGAVGIVVLNNQESGQLMTMSDDGSGRIPEIPAAMLELNDSKTLLFWLERRPMLATLIAHNRPPSPGQANLTSLRQVHAAQQQQRKREKQASSSAAAAAAAQANPDAIVQTRIDMFVPGRSQPWVQQHVVKAGINGQEAYQSLARDPRVLHVLRQAYVSNKAHNGSSTQRGPLTGLHAATSTQRAQPRGHSGG